jgi:hypothetical protein
MHFGLKFSIELLLLSIQSRWGQGIYLVLSYHSGNTLQLVKIQNPRIFRKGTNHLTMGKKFVLITDE